jgi:flagellar biogenesis protein FliO
MKRLGLFFLAPFVGLAYALALPFVGFYMLVKIASQAARVKRREKRLRIAKPKESGYRQRS